MRLDIGQEQTQKIILTPELRQAIKVLQLPVLELNTFVEQELTENPVLELIETEETTEGESVDREEENEEKFDQEWEDYFQDSSDLGIPAPARREEREILPDTWLAAAPTLHEHLQMQLALSPLHDREKKIGRYLIGNIDDHGYLRVSTTDAARDCRTDNNEVEKVITSIQSFDPPGVGARDLKECLLLQAALLNNAHPILEIIIRNHLDDVGKGKLNRVASVLDVDRVTLEKALDQLKLLDPKPGRNFTHPNDTRYVVPDIVVEKVGGEYIVLVNDQLSPRLSINQLYRQTVNDPGTEASVKKFIETKINSALWLIKSIEQRRLTLYRVAAAVVEMQKPFLDRGVKALRPLHLRQVADMTKLHESTISRATANKYMQTPRGVFALKFFFAGGTVDLYGEGMAPAGIKKTISEIIESENPAKPFSDQQLAGKLKEQGIEISRRTVAKYRDEMGIGAAIQRKRV